MKDFVAIILLGLLFGWRIWRFVRAMSYFVRVARNKSGQRKQRAQGTAPAGPLGNVNIPNVNTPNYNSPNTNIPNSNVSNPNISNSNAPFESSSRDAWS